MKTIDTVKEEYKKLVASLNRERDELRLQMHLANMEAKEEWAELEVKWTHMKAKNKEIGKTFGKTSEEVGEEIKKIGEDIARGYKRLKDIL